MRESFDTVALEELFNGTSTYTLQTLEELNTLEETIQESLKSSESSQRVIAVIVKESVNTNDLDQIIEKLFGVAKANNDNTMMILSGKEGAHQDERLLSFAQTVSAQAGDNTGVRINKYLTPNVLTGLMVAIFIFSILLFGFLLLFDVQTPTVFATQSIDFGKIEK